MKAKVVCTLCGEKFEHEFTVGVHTQSGFEKDVEQEYGDLVDVICSRGHTSLDVLAEDKKESATDESPTLPEQVVEDGGEDELVAA